MIKISLRLLTLLFLILAYSNYAQAEEFKYQPDYCEFSITFPEEAYKTQRCSKDDANLCFEVQNYTKVYEAGPSVNFRVWCEDSSLAAYQSYNEPTTKMVLKALAKRNNSTLINTTYSEDESERYKIAGLVGEGKRGYKGMIYLTQMWIGKKSVMTIEAELVGEEYEESDILFRDILKTIHYDVTKKESEKSDDDSSSKDDSSEETDGSSEDSVAEE